jgi:hypothetical protein
VVIEDDPPAVNVAMQDGLPPDITKLDGYLYSGYVNNPSNGNYDLLTYGVFAEPEKNLTSGYNHYTNSFDWSLTTRLGNIDVGDVSVNKNKLSKMMNTPNLIYTYGIYSQFISNSIRWFSEGNKSFKPLDVTLENLPLFTPRVKGDTLSTVIKSKSYVLNSDSVATGFDSLVVIIYDWSSSPVNTRKAIKKGSKTITFNAEDFKDFSPGNTWLSFQIFAFRYSYCTIENKTILFELSNKCTKWVMSKN